MSDTSHSPRLSRRSALRLMGAAGAGAACPALLGAPAIRRFPERPNILVIMSDEHNAAVTGCYGNRLVRTPHLDALAARGVLFDACYTPSPLCVPARLAFTSGKYISRTGAWSNNSWLPSDDIPSLPRLLNAAGYQTVLCGKMHYDRTRRYGFAMDLGIGNQHYKTGTGRRRPADDLNPRPGISRRFRNFRIGTEKENGCMQQALQVTTKGSEFLRARTPDDPPFFMIAGYLPPHFPLIVPEKWWRPHAGRVPMPVIPPGHLDALPLNYKHLRIGFNMEDVPAEIVRKGRELYFGFVEWLDAQIGRLLAALNDSKVADNTVVIYTSDHGENMGEHGLWWKNCMYQHAARVPLIVSWPARWAGGQRRTEACSLLDVVQTIAQLAGRPCPDDWDGDSMCAWLDDPSRRWKDRAISQYYAHNVASGFVMVRQGPFKYVYHSPPDARHPAEEELYDLRSDPGEFVNLAGRPEYRFVCRTMFDLIVKELGEHPDEVEARCRADYAKGYGRPPRKKGGRSLRNGSFRQGDRFWLHRGVQGRYRVLPHAGRDGRPAIVFHKSKDDPHPISENSHLDQYVQVTPHTRYRLKMRVKAPDGLRPVLRAADRKSRSLVEIPARASNDWQTVEKEFDTGDETLIRVQFFGGARGRIRQTAPGTSILDFVSLEPVPPGGDAKVDP